MNEIVKYHNKMNTVNFRGFNAVELDLLFSICSKIRDEGLRTIVYSFDDLRILSKYKFTGNNRFVKDLENTYDKILALKFKLGDQENFTKFVLFTKYAVSVNKKQITITVNEEFSYLLNELTSNFTRFELNEFVNLESKYTKNVYRLLKQYRTTGCVYFTLEDFRNKLDIPKGYRISEIDKKVLTPIQKELSSLFNHFKIEKIKNTKKRGHPVTNINFYFSPQEMIGKQLLEIDTPQSLHEKYLNDFTIKEIQFLLKYGSEEDLKIASKQYKNYQNFAGIENKMGFMINVLKAMNLREKNNDNFDELEMLLFGNE